MILSQSLNLSKPLSLLCTADADSNHLPVLFNSHLRSHGSRPSNPFPLFAVSGGSDSKPDPKHTSKRESKTRRKTEASQNELEDSGTDLQLIIPRKPRRGRRSEAVAVEDFVRGSLSRTFESIRKKNPEVLDDKDSLMKEKVVEEMDSEDSDDEEEEEGEGVSGGEGKKKKMVVEEESKDWPLDTDVGWGIRASEYFEKHSIKNVVGEDGFEIDWEGEIDDNWVNEINCLEWESFAFHPSPLIVLVFERYNRYFL